MGSLLAGCSSSASHQQTAVSWAEHYDNIHDLTAHSTIVVAGSFTAVTKQTTSGNNPSTDFTFTVSKVLADKAQTTAAGSAITIHQTGGSMSDGTPVSTEDDPLFKVGETTVLFLHQYSPGHFYVVGGPNGRFETHAATTKSAGVAEVEPFNSETVQFTGSVDQLAAEVAKP
ncbi:hypothetical protein [Catenulispora sp. GAS73]|uniref:hypothetical protein n=1 Tax=Catenulispora sp. GAS73 TaxID=3156269 RepID=UPI003512F353